MIMKIKILVMFLIFSCSVNTEMDNSISDIELPALRVNQSFSKGYRVLKTTITDPFIFDTKFPATDLSIGYVLRYYFYTAIDLSSTNNVLLSMNNNSFSMPETSDPIELVRADIYEIRDMAYGSKDYQDFVEKYFSGCIDISIISSNCVIPTLYEPVCGCDGFNYTNSSAADCNGVLNYYEGPCK